MVEVGRTEAFRATLRGLPERTTFRTQIREGKRWVKIGVARSNGKGRMSLPALQAKKLGEYVVRMKPPSGPAYYIKILVTKPD